MGENDMPLSRQTIGHYEQYLYREYYFCPDYTNFKYYLTHREGDKKVAEEIDRKIYKDTNSEKHIKLVFDYQVPNTILRELNLNSKKQVPMITTLQGFEPYNLMDLSNDEYIKQKTESDAKAIIYSERYKDHINLLINKSPYQAANAFLLLQSNINMKIQECIRDILAQGNILTVDSLIHYSFENIAEATRELFTKYHAFNTTEEEKLKITRFIALYFAVVEEADNNVDNYVKSLNEKYGIVKNE